MNNKLLSKLNKSEILSLPGFNRYKSYVMRQLIPLLRDKKKELGIDFRGVRVNDYIKRFNEVRESNKKRKQNKISRHKTPRMGTCVGSSAQ